MPGITGDEGVALLRETLNAYELRIEFSASFSMTGAGMRPCAILSVKEADRWRKVKLPAIYPTEGGTRADLLRLFADMLEQAVPVPIARGDDD